MARMTTSLREATPADGPALWSVLAPAFRAGDTYTLAPDISQIDALAYWMAPGNAVFVAEDGQTILGTFYLRPNAEGGGCHVANAGFVTAPRARGRGLARFMLNRAEIEARARGFLAMQFNFVVATNAAALHIWRTEGYAEVGRLPRAFRHPTEGFVDALVLYKFLQEAETWPTTAPSSPS